MGSSQTRMRSGVGVRRGVAIAAIGAILVLAAGAPALAQGTGGTVSWFGGVHCGEEFVFVLDTSGSMGWDGALAVAVAETQAAITSLAPGQNFSIVAFSNATNVFSPTLLPPDPVNIAAAQAWLAGLDAAGESCAAQGIIEALAILDTGTGDGAVLVVGDSEQQCSQAPTSVPAALAAIAAANTANDPISGYYLGSDSGGFLFYAQLAIQNPGTGAGCPQTFRRGDANGDDTVDVADAVRILEIAFQGSTAPFCELAADVNDDEVFQGIPDAISLLAALFGGGGIVLPPYPGCGVDPTPSALVDCAAPGSCP